MTLMTTMTDDDDDDLDVAHSHRSGSSSTTPYQIKIWKCCFEERRKPNVPEKNVLEKAQRERTHNKPSTHVALTPGFKRKPHLRETSAFAIVPPLLPVINLVCVCVIQSKKKPFHADNFMKSMPHFFCQPAKL